MSENLIYGADIRNYGGIGDGATDCSVALNKAIENGENLISFPFGTYLFTKPIILNSNTKLHFHANANILFTPDKNVEKSFISAKNASSLEICGGLFNINDGCKCNVFSFDDCQNIRICGCSINAPTAISAISLNGCEYVSVQDVSSCGICNFISLMNECEKITIKKCSIKAAANVVQCGNRSAPCSVCGLDIRDFNVSFCDSFIEFLCGNADCVSIENIEARFSFAFLKLFAEFSLGDAAIENIRLYIIHRKENDGKALAYFSLASTPENLEVRSFKRLNELESTPASPTLLFTSTKGEMSKLIIDGISLDNVIAARGKSKSVGMTTAKLTNPTGKFIYTLEVSAAKGDNFCIPSGDFDFMTVYGG